MPKIHPDGLIFSLTPITIKPHAMKVYIKGTFLFYKLLGKIYFKYANEFEFVLV